MAASKQAGGSFLFLLLVQEAGTVRLLLRKASIIKVDYWEGEYFPSKPMLKTV